MVTEAERRFFTYWEQNRLKEKKLIRQLLIGLPIGLVFAVPIIINLSAGWYKRADMWSRAHISNSGTAIIVIAVLLIAVFVAIFYRRHKWDIYEQQYHEIQAKMKAEQPSF